MNLSSRILSFTIGLTFIVSSTMSVLAQDPMPTLPPKNTPVPVIAEGEATPEATADVPPDDAAQFEQTPISDLVYNTAVIGRIDNTTPEQVWPLPLASADRLRIEVVRLDGNLIPDVALLSPAGEELGLSYGAEPDAASAIIENVTVAAAGMLSVRVTRDRGVEGQTEGFYELRIIPLSVAEDAAANAQIVGTLTTGETVTGTITAEHWQHRYTYNAVAADSIRIVAERTIGNLQPYVELLDVNGSVLVSGYPDEARDLAVTNRITLPAAGTYTVVVTRNQEFSGWTTGDYMLTIEIVGSGLGSPNLAGTVGEIIYDTPLTGEITPERWYEDWTLTTTAGDRLTLIVQSDTEAGNLQPEILLLGGSGQELARGYTDHSGDIASIVGRTLDGPGTYTVRIARSQGQNGITTGAYNLLVALDGAGLGSESLNGAAGSLSVGEPVAGEITNARWADIWTLSGAANQRIEVVVERTSGTLIPTLEIRDLNGQPLRNGYYESTRDRALLQYTFPSTGDYQLVILRDGQQGGATRGSYTLRVNEAQ